MIPNDQIEVFGQTPSGEDVHRITLKGGGLTAKILTYGATIQDLRLDGHAPPLVLGAETLAPYMNELRYVGALVGRYANRIANGRFEIDGQRYQVSQNFKGQHCLHGGAQGSDQMIWSVKEIMPESATLSLVMPDGHMGFPGELTVEATISLTRKNSLSFEITAKASKATPCCFAHHGYFNLDGSKEITHHKLQVFADHFLPVDDDLIPTGELLPLKGSDFDFCGPETIGARGIDHNFCLANEKREICTAARLSSATSGLSMAIETTEAGLQIYDGAYFPNEGISGLEGRIYGPCAGIAVETQTWPDAPNRVNFPASILRPGETYHHSVRYVFTRHT